MELLAVNDLRKVYSSKLGKQEYEALKKINFNVIKGEYIAIMGESGSGKSTLLNILAGLDKKTSGSIKVEGVEVTQMKEGAIAKYRREKLGFVFQEFNLLDTLNVKDNIAMPLVLSQINSEEILKKVNLVINRLNISYVLNKYPYELSGGEKQRVAVARAIIHEPILLLADEPTGALDSKSTDHLLEIFNQINESGQTILMVTHSVKSASNANRVLFIKDGIIYHELYRGNQLREEFFTKISNTLTSMQGRGKGNE